MNATTLYNHNPSDWTDTLEPSPAVAAHRRALDTFLAGVERRALVMAELATHQREEALDLVQDAMLAFVASYGNKPQAEWPPLFHRVLQNRIRDWGRRNTVRSRWRVWLKGREDEPDVDPLQQAADPAGRSPEELLVLDDAGDALMAAIEALPVRQQQAFLLRTWEGLDVVDTARAMGCSTGSVKTHLSRAMHALRGKLKGHWS